MAGEPPYRVVTERLVIRCWEPRDAPLLKEAVDASLDHLRPWMPWAHEEPTPIEEKVALLRAFRGRFDLGEDYVYGLFDREESRVVGGSGLHTRVGRGALEIGYWIRASHARRGLVTEATAALTRVAFAVAGVDRVEIHVDPGNVASLGVPRKLGFREEAVLRRRLPTTVDGPPERDMVLFALYADDVATTAIADAMPEAYDALGVRLL